MIVGWMSLTLAVSMPNHRAWEEEALYREGVRDMMLRDLYKFGGAGAVLRALSLPVRRR